MLVESKGKPPIEPPIVGSEYHLGRFTYAAGLVSRGVLTSPVSACPRWPHLCADRRNNETRHAVNRAAFCRLLIARATPLNSHCGITLDVPLTYSALSVEIKFTTELMEFSRSQARRHVEIIVDLRLLALLKFHALTGGCLNTPSNSAAGLARDMLETARENRTARPSEVNKGHDFPDFA